MKKIRKNVFETNSSSTHSICVAKDVELIIPEEIYFEFGEFGWEISTLSSVSEKASYLYTGLIYLERRSDFNLIVRILEDKGIKVSFEPESKSNWSYVDHAGELTEFLDMVTTSETELMNYLFSPLSFVLTGNDNDDEDVNIDVNYPYNEYYKGN
jgi:hypothetical protein